MAKNLVDIKTNVTQIAKIKVKLENYPPYAIQEGLENVNTYLNSDQFKVGLYAESQMGAPFPWTNDRQRRKVMALLREQGGPPYERTFEMAKSGEFVVDKKYSSLFITYQNAAPYFQWVQGVGTQIIGHIRRGWQPVNAFVVDHGAMVKERFEAGIKGAWDRMKGEAPGQKQY